jgi:hypothetical protein
MGRNGQPALVIRGRRGLKSYPKRAAKKGAAKKSAMQKAATHDVVLTSQLRSPAVEQVESASFLGQTKSLDQFRKELGWDD